MSQLELDFAEPAPLGVEPGAVVRGNYSSIEYVVQIVGGDRRRGFWLNCKCKDNNLQSGHFSGLGPREGDELPVLDPARPHDRILVISDKKQSTRQKKGKLSG